MPRRHAIELGLFVAVLIVVAAGGLFIGERLADQLSGHSAGPAGPAASGSSSPTPSAATPTPTPTMPASTPSPLPSPSPSPSPTATAAPTPTRTPTVTPAPTPLLHVVKHNETLSSIAGLYGVSVAALISANGITDRNVIITGQVLIIPRP